jgi:hypothetical protein
MMLGSLKIRTYFKGKFSKTTAIYARNLMCRTKNQDRSGKRELNLIRVQTKSLKKSSTHAVSTNRLKSTLEQLPVRLKKWSFETSSQQFNQR